MKALDAAGFACSVIVLGAALHAVCRSPRWWEDRRAVPPVESLPLLRMVDDHSVPEVRPWVALPGARGLFALASREPEPESVADDGDSPKPAPPEPTPAVAPRFELVGCAETERGWAALVRDRITGETALLCVSDVEPRWAAQLVSLRGAARPDGAEFEMRDARPCPFSEAPVESVRTESATPPDAAGTANSPESRQGSL